MPTLSLGLSLALSLACRQPEAPCSGLNADGDGVCEGLAVDWSEDVWLEPGTHRANIYGLALQDLERVTQDGLAHTMVWPVTVTGLRMPYRPLKELLSNPDNGTIQGLTRQVAGFGSMEELYEPLGLPPIPDNGSVPLPLDLQPGDPMGAAVVDTEHGQALVFSCAACHAHELFGQTVVGLPNKNARPNAFFDLAAKVLPTVPSDVFQDLSGATDGEIFLYEEAVESISWVGTRNPQVLGLDTSLAQVSLSLSKRGQDESAGYRGSVEKVWDQPGAQDLPLGDQLTTAALYYSPRTRPVDVGTDSSRAQGVQALEELNRLAISQSMGTVVRAGVG